MPSEQHQHLSNMPFIVVRLADQHPTIALLALPSRLEPTMIYERKGFTDSHRTLAMKERGNEREGQKRKKEREG